MGIQMAEEKEIEFEVKFKINEQEVKRIKEIVDEMENIIVEMQRVSIETEKLEDEEDEEVQQKIKELKIEEEEYEQRLDTLEKELKEILGIQYDAPVLYEGNDGYIRYYPAIVVRGNGDYTFWIDISPKVAIYFTL